jgi:hypothetical protein
LVALKGRVLAAAVAVAPAAAVGDLSACAGEPPGERVVPGSARPNAAAAAADDDGPFPEADGDLSSA